MYGLSVPMYAYVTEYANIGTLSPYEDRRTTSQVTRFDVVRTMVSATLPEPKPAEPIVKLGHTLALRRKFRSVTLFRHYKERNN